jgi:hypothetical protein
MVYPGNGEKGDVFFISFILMVGFMVRILNSYDHIYRMHQGLSEIDYYVTLFIHLKAFYFIFNFIK